MTIMAATDPVTERKVLQSDSNDQFEHAKLEKIVPESQQKQTIAATQQAAHVTAGRKPLFGR